MHGAIFVDHKRVASGAVSDHLYVIRPKLSAVTVRGRRCAVGMAVCKSKKRLAARAQFVLITAKQYAVDCERLVVLGGVWQDEEVLYQGCAASEQMFYRSTTEHRCKFTWCVFIGCGEEVRFCRVCIGNIREHAHNLRGELRLSQPTLS